MRWYQRLRLVLEPLVIAFFIVTFLFSFVGISGDSMEPSLSSGERAFVPRYQSWLQRFGWRDFQRGDIIYFRPPSEFSGAPRPLPLLGRWLELSYQPFFIKRLIALPGERVAIDQGQLYINGVQLEEAYLDHLGLSSMAEMQIPDDHVFVLGDNRKPLGSVDSRRFGSIPLDSVAGRVNAVVFPLLRRDSQGRWHWNARWLEPPSSYPHAQP